MDIWERIRYARDRALEAEQTDREDLAGADTADRQQAASVRLATRQAVREALDDVLDEHSEPAQGHAMGDTAVGRLEDAGDGGTVAGASQPSDAVGALVGTATAVGDDEMTHGVGGTVEEGDVSNDPGSQITG